MEATTPDFTPIYARLATQASIPAGSVLDTDAVLHRGTGEGWLTDGDGRAGFTPPIARPDAAAVAG